MRWIKLVVVVGLRFSTSKVTNKAKVESTSAEWLVQGTTRRSCLCALVSATLDLEWRFLHWSKLIRYAHNAGLAEHYLNSPVLAVYWVQYLHGNYILWKTLYPAIEVKHANKWTGTIYYFTWKCSMLWWVLCVSPNAAMTSIILGAFVMGWHLPIIIIDF